MDFNPEYEFDVRYLHYLDTNDWSFFGDRVNKYVEAGIWIFFTLLGFGLIIHLLVRHAQM